MNMLDYIEWRGDLPFEKDPLNEVDALIFSLIAYYSFEQFNKITGNVAGYSLAEYVQLHNNNASLFGDINKQIDIDNDIFPSKTAPYVLSKAAKTARFAGVRIVDFRDVFDEDRVVQFAAMTFELDNGHRVVAYRGTDSSIIGWKEDCMLSYLTEIPGQTEAISYFNETKQGKKYYIVGHSKGANEALYTFLKMDKARLADVEAIYNFDGPGFLENIHNTPRYQTTKNKIHTFVPTDSIVGMILEHEKDFVAVKSNGHGIKQHNPLFWQVKGPCLETECNNEWVREVADRTFTDFLKELSLEDRQFVTETVFAIVNNCGAKSIAELYKNPIKNTRIILASYSKLPEEQKEILIKASKALGFSWAANYRLGIGDVKPGDKKPLLKPLFRTRPRL